MEPQDTITIAPSVLITIARQAAIDVKGIARMGTIPIDVTHLLKGNPMGSGVVLEIEEGKVSLEVYLIVKPGVSMRDVSKEVQNSVTRSIQELVGMEVIKVNVHIEDVDFTPGDRPETA
ncbi:MAG: Asp23/Gls24 family envelope stress response protein [Anaerolineae bacterium]|nr:Asp23/Gls24 family envelope stress response protein [Anaerolineae bacterium]